MHALVSTGNADQPLQMAEVAEPVRRLDDLLVSVLMSTVNRGEQTRLQRPGSAQVYGWDVLGTVLDPGASGSFTQGDVVAGLALHGGGWAERAVLRPADVAQVPPGVAMVAAASLPVAGLTALRALRHAPALLGAAVAVTGASGAVGQFAVQLARRAGARVTAVTRDPAQAGSLRDLGARDVVTLESLPPASFDLVVDCLGGDSTVAAVRSVHRTGRVVVVGNLRPAADTFSPALIVQAEAWVCGYRLTVDAQDTPVGHDLETLLAWVADGTLVTPPAHAVEWRDREAVGRAATSGHGSGRSVLHITSE